jgi:hypothetical protein
MLSDIFSLGGVVAFILGVLLATWVKSAVGGLKGKVAS